MVVLELVLTTAMSNLCFAEKVLICDLDYLIRHDLAKNDSSHNEVERIQSYVGDAICDRSSLEWE